MTRNEPDMLARSLTRKGYVIELSTREKLLQRVQREPGISILLDIEMPGKSAA